MIAVLGSTGTIGRHVVKGLGEEGLAFRSLSRPQHDLADRDSLVQGMKGAEQLFLLTPHAPEQEIWEAHALGAAIEAGVKRVVKLSGGEPSLGPNGPSSSSVAHWRSERMIEASGVDFCFLRSSFLMQNLDAIPITRGLLLAPMGKSPIAMIDARDVAMCAVASLRDREAQNQVWHLTGPRGVTFGDVARAQHARYVNVPLPLARAALKRRGASAFEIDHSIGMAAYFASGADSAPTSSVRSLTGQPPRSLDEYLRERH